MARFLMAVSGDRYELPLAIEPTQKKLADKLGISRSLVAHCLLTDSPVERLGNAKILTIEIED